MNGRGAIWFLRLTRSLKDPDLQLTDQAETALPQLLALLDEADYQFVPITPASHQRVLTRPDKSEARDLRDVFGWSLPFAPDLLAPEMLRLLEEAGVLGQEEGRLKSAIRVGRLHGRLLIHSAFPTTQDDAVFLSPDSFRFADFARAELARASGTGRLVDIGAGGGAGALSVASVVPGARLTLCDINPLALRIARINAAYAGLDIETVEGGVEDVAGPFDAAIANPPFMIDEEDRTYRDGGGMHGARLSLDWAIAAMERLSPGGRLLLYTGAAIVDGRDELREALEAQAAAHGYAMGYREIDPDIYGEELGKAAYADVDRIAAVGAVLEKGG